MYYLFNSQLNVELADILWLADYCSLLLCLNTELFLSNMILYIIEISIQAMKQPETCNKLNLRGVLNQILHHWAAF